MLMSITSINSADSEANWSGVVNFHCMQMVMTEMACHVHHVFLLSGNDM